MSSSDEFNFDDVEVDLAFEMVAKMFKTFRKEGIPIKEAAVLAAYMLKTQSELQEKPNNGE